MVLGAARLVALPTADCSPEGKPWAGAPCFDPVFARLLKTGEASATVVGLFRSTFDGEVVRGTYGYDFTLYDVTRQAAKFNVAKIEIQTSAVRAPKDCFSLPDEDVFYRMDKRDGNLVAQEMQIVVCGGPVKLSYGGYMAQGATIPAKEPPVGQAPPVTGAMWGVTEKRHLIGAQQYLAVKGGNCPKSERLDGNYCAEALLDAFANDPKLSELNVIATEKPVEVGALLPAKDVEQWAVSRKGKGKKAKFEVDERWFPGGGLKALPGCVPSGETVYRVVRSGDHLYAREEVLAQCGAPPAPTR
jgi:hypothetical protein